VKQVGYVMHINSKGICFTHVIIKRPTCLYSHLMDIMQPSGTSVKYSHSEVINTLLIWHNYFI